MIVCKIFVFISLFVLILGEKIDWDYMVFSQEWPPTFCHNKKCEVKTKDFNIHGLWPTIFPQKEISKCSGASEFDISKLQTIRAQLDIEWSDLLKGHNPGDFWKHEWEKHGSCAVEDDLIKNEVTYFLTGLNLKKKVQTLEYLSKVNITPSSSTAYNTNDVTNALQDLYSIRNINLICLKVGNNDWLSEIRYCVDKNLNLMDCQDPNEVFDEISENSRNHICGDNFYLPEFVEN